jgi:hypothetical protein
VHGATATRDAIAGLACHFDAGDYVDAPAVPIDADAHPKLTIGGWIKVSMIVCNQHISSRKSNLSRLTARVLHHNNESCTDSLCICDFVMLISSVVYLH